MKRSVQYFPASLLAMISTVSFAQIKEWTLDECIMYALEHNVEVMRKELSAEGKRIGLSEAKWSYVPSFSAGSSYSLSSGRVLDETTYSFIENETAGSSSASVSGSIEVFAGMRKMHELKYAGIDLKASLAEIEVAGLELKKNVAAYYLEALCAKENIAVMEQIADQLEVQEEKTSVKVKAGKVTEADLLQIRARLYSARNDVLTARNTYMTAKISLCHLLEIDDYDGFDVSSPGDIPLGDCGILPDMEEAVERRPEVIAAALDVELAKSDFKIAQSYYSPSISLSAGYGSSHSDARQKIFQNPDGTFQYEAYPFFRQYADNASSYVSVSINIPIFTGLSVRKNVQRKRLAIKDSEYALASVRKSVKEEQYRIKTDAVTAWEKYLSAAEQVKYTEEVTRMLTVKYEVGATDILSYITAVTELAKAKYTMNAAKYEYIFKVKILNML